MLLTRSIILVERKTQNVELEIGGNVMDALRAHFSSRKVLYSVAMRVENSRPSSTPFLLFGARTVGCDVDEELALQIYIEYDEHSWN